VCPNPLVVDFQSLPDCGRACVRSELEANGCPADYSESSSTAQFNRNCFCRLESNATLQQSCLAAASCNETASEAQDTLNLLYQQNCVYAQDNSGQNDIETTGDQVVQSASSSGGSIDNVNLWLSIFGSLVALIAFTSAVMIWVKRVVSFATSPRLGFILILLSGGMQDRPEGGTLLIPHRTGHEMQRLNDVPLHNTSTSWEVIKTPTAPRTPIVRTRDCFLGLR
jgi:hypothetical protein